MNAPAGALLGIGETRTYLRQTAPLPPSSLMTIADRRLDAASLPAGTHAAVRFLAGNGGP